MILTPISVLSTSLVIQCLYQWSRTAWSCPAFLVLKQLIALRNNFPNNIHHAITFSASRAPQHLPIPLQYLASMQQGNQFWHRRLPILASPWTPSLYCAYPPLSAWPVLSHGEIDVWMIESSSAQGEALRRVPKSCTVRDSHKYALPPAISIINAVAHV